VHGERAHFAALYEWLAAEVIFAADQARLNALPPQARVKLLAVVAALARRRPPAGAAGRAAGAARARRRGPAWPRAAPRTARMQRGSRTA